MQQSIGTTSEVVAQAKCNFERSSDRLIHLLSFVPDDKLLWAPSPTAKSSLRIVVHCALTNTFFANVITGSLPERMPSAEEFFSSLHGAEEKINTRENAIAVLKGTTAELCKAIDTVNSENLNTAPNSPFGPMPMKFWLDLGGQHEAGHVGQLEYLQTIWGDLDNHQK